MNGFSGSLQGLHHPCTAFACNTDMRARDLAAGPEVPFWARSWFVRLIAAGVLLLVYLLIR